MKKLHFLIGFVVWIVFSFFAFDAFSINHQTKIYDCFLFYNELEVLEIKLNELYDYVDYFVIVESKESFRGNPKTLYFYENKERFNKFLDKIIHVVAGNVETNNPWEREAYQRNQIMQGLTCCKKCDIIIIEDLDEIIRTSKLREIISLLFEGNKNCVYCSQKLYRYYLNRYECDDDNACCWLGSAIAKFADVRRTTPQKIREKKGYGHIIPDAGWHFTSMGGVSRVIKKFENFSHSELDTESFKSVEKIQKDIEALRLVEIDETYPKYVQENVDYFKELGLID
jgi:beta-1,4-mannosyl-glycoprotein beta-1,4-N-acetylglucosaminyltransferase